jgi:tetratricopeptide (TPR) repeat protein
MLDLSSIDLGVLSPLQLDVGSKLSVADWNGRFQRLLDFAPRSSASAARHALAVAELEGAFTAAAIEAARTIVAELALPEGERTAVPITFDEATLAIDAAASAASAGAAAGKAQSRAARLRQMREAKAAKAAGSGATALTSALIVGYLQNGIFFRFACERDSERAAFGSDADAADDDDDSRAVASVQRKRAGVEVRASGAVQRAALRAYRSSAAFAAAPQTAALSDDSAPPVRLCTPLSCVVDVYGVRLHAVAALPLIEDESLKYGVSSSGGAFVDSDAAARGLVTELGQALALKPHAIASAAGATNLPLSARVQVHVGSDARYYLLEVAELTPPEFGSAPPPPSDAEMSDAVAAAHAADAASAFVASRRLRPEWLGSVRGSAPRLSADAFVAGSAELDDVECAAWYLRMVHDTAPALTRRIDALELGGVFHSEALAAALHDAGLNVRHLGLVASFAMLPHARDAAIVEMIARVAKAELRNAQRNIVWSWATAQSAESSSSRGAAKDAAALAWAQLAGEQRVHAATLFDLVLGASADCDAFWTSVLAPGVFAKFGFNVASGTYGEAEWVDGRESAVLNARRAVHLPALLFALSHHCGFELRDGANAAALDALAPRLGATAQPIALDALVLVAGGVSCKASFEIGGAAGCGDAASDVANGATAKLAAGELSAEAALAPLQLKVRLARARCKASGDAAQHTRRRFALARDLVAAATIAADTKAWPLVAAFANEVATLVPARHCLVGAASLLLMRAHCEFGAHDIVAQAYREGVAAVRFHLGRHHPLLVELHVTFGDLQLNLAEALRLSLPPLPLAPRSPTRLAPEPSAATMAVLQQREERLALARDAFEQAESLARTALGSSHPTCARLALHLGQYATEMGDGIEAVEAFTKAVAMFDAITLPGGNGSLDAAVARVTLSETLAARGDFGGALRIAEEALHVRIAVSFGREVRGG